MLNNLFVPFCIECNRCGSFVCERCQEDRIFVTNLLHLETSLEFDVIAMYEYGGILKKLLKEYKFKGYAFLASYIRKFISEYFDLDPFGFISTLFRYNYVNIVVPIPTNKTRLASRGFWAVDLIFKKVFENISNSIYYPDLLTMVDSNIHQSRISYRERINHMKGLFYLNSNAFSYFINLKLFSTKKLHFIIVDDVISTGATIVSVVNLINKFCLMFRLKCKYSALVFLRSESRQ